MGITQKAFQDYPERLHTHMAGDAGVEPTLTVLETAVLPLN